MPKVSVIMGIYNCSNYLEQAISCITQQTFTDWELIICDDGSSDDSYKLAISRAKCDERIKVIRNEKNASLAPSLNRCLQLAKGEYIARMDGDDICANDRLEKEVCFLDSHQNYVLVSSYLELFDQSGVYRTVAYKKTPEPRDFLMGAPFCHPACMIRKNVLTEQGGYDESEDCKRVEDFALWVKLYAHGYRGYNLQEVLYSKRDDYESFKKRTLKNRINEARVIRKASRTFALGKFGYSMSFIPILKYFIPRSIYHLLHRRSIIKQ